MLYTTFTDKVKDRNHSITSTDTEKKPAKSLHCFIIITRCIRNMFGPQSYVTIGNKNPKFQYASFCDREVWSGDQ